jgi:toxin CcdB
MAQYDVYENTNAQTMMHIPYLLDVQHTLHDRLHSRVVIPLSRDANEVKGLCIPLEVQGEKLIATVPEMGGVSKTLLGKKVDNLSMQASEILNGIDLLLTGF